MSKHTSTTYACGANGDESCSGMTYAEAVQYASDRAEDTGLVYEIWDARDPEATTERFSPSSPR